jgi:hypothetical protein
VAKGKEIMPIAPAIAPDQTGPPQVVPAAEQKPPSGQ